MTQKSQSKFAAGDKVVCNEEYPHTGEYFMFKGIEYVVSKCDEHFVEFEGKPNYRYLVKSFDLVQAAFTNMKFRVSSPEQSKEIQEALFEMGYKWLSVSDTVQYTDASFLYTSDAGNILTGSFECTFKESTEQEHTIETTKSYKLIPVEIPKPEPAKETITIDGKTYDKQAVLKRLAELGEVK